MMMPHKHALTVSLTCLQRLSKHPHCCSCMGTSTLARGACPCSARRLRCRCLLNTDTATIITCCC